MVQAECEASAAGIAQLVEHNLAKVGVAGSSPVSRSARLIGKRIIHSGAIRTRSEARRMFRVPDGRLAQLVRAPR